MSFVPDQGKTLSSVSIYCSAVAGTLGNISGTANLCGDASGIPNSGTIIETVTVPAGSWPAAGNWVTFSGFTTTLTAGTRYWIVFKNTSAAPATDYPTLRHGSSSTLTTFSNSSSAKWGWAKNSTTDSGATWPSSSVGTAGLFIGYSDGSYDGLAVSDISGGAAGTGGVYANRESGVVFTTPANAKLNVRGISFFVAYAGTPTGSVRYRLYEGTTLLATTSTMGLANLTSGSWNALYFSSTQTLSPSTVYRAVLSETSQSDSSTNFYRVYEYTIKNDANAKAVLPFGGTLKQTYTADATANPPVFTDVDTKIVPFALILDTDGEFAASGGGGGLLTHPGMTGGMRG